MKRLLRLFVLAGVVTQPSLAFAQQPAIKNVLLVFSHERERGVYEALDESLRSALRPGPAVGLNTFTEYLDLLRFPGGDQQMRMIEYLRAKYADVEFGLIVAVSPPALDFVLQHRATFFPGVPIVFTSVSASRIAELARYPNVTGVAVKHDVTSTLDIVLRLQPDAVSVVIPTGSSPIDRVWTEDARRLLQPYERRIAITFLPEMSMNELEERLKVLPPHTVVVSAGLLDYDATGQYFLPDETLRRICRSSDAPVYGTNAPELGSGIVGGSLYNIGLAGSAAGDVGRLILAGESVANIPIRTLNLDTPTFDARQLTRWHIDEQRLPAGSVVRYRTPSLWRDYRPQMLAAVAVAAAQTLLIVGLLFEHRRRRAAEARSRTDLASLAQLERRGAMGQLTGSIAHELYQPLGAILRNAEAGKMMIAAETPPTLAELHEIFEDIRKDDKRASEVIQRMRALLQKHDLETRPVNINDLVRETAALLAPEAEARGVRVDVDAIVHPSVALGDRIHLQQVVLNLMLNALDALMAVPAERRRLSVRTRLDGSQIEVSVEDSGGGIPFDPVSKVFEPFLTTKAQGMGMGLSIARSIIEAHGGRLSAVNNSRGGATLTFSVPFEAQTASPGSGTRWGNGSTTKG